MHVGFVTSSYPDDVRDPRGIFVHRLARGLVKQGVDVTVVAPGSDRAPKAESRNGVGIRRYSYWWSGGQRITRDLSGIEPTIRNSPQLALQLPPLVLRLAQGTVNLARDWDVVHAHWLYPAGLAVIATRLAHKLPVVVTSHGGDLSLARRFPLFRWLGRYVARRADYCIGVSHRDCRMLKTLTSDESKVEFMPVGVDDIDSEMVAPAVGTAADTSLLEFADYHGLKVLYVGSLVPRKSVATVLRSVYHLQREGIAVRCAILGDGPEKAELMKLSVSEGMTDVWFGGNRSPEEIPGWMAAADILVLPSLSEPWGSVVSEAMAAETPAVVSETAGTATLIDHERSGYLIPEGDAEALGTCLRSYIELSEKERSAMGAAARKAVRQAGILTHKIARRHQHVYREITGART